MQGGVLGLKDSTHATFADLLDNLVLPDSPSDHVTHSPARAGEPIQIHNIVGAIGGEFTLDNSN